MSSMELILSIVKIFFPGLSLDELWEKCPNHMLWEAIKNADACTISRDDILDYLLHQNSWFLFPEPLADLRNGYVPKYTQISCLDLSVMCETDVEELFEQEPIYIVDCNCSWMIVLTTENEQDGSQLCVLVYAK